MSIQDFKMAKNLEWFFESLRFTIYCPRRMLERFEFRVEPSRTPFGWTLICRRCKGNHCSVSMVDVADYHATIIVSCMCFDCGYRWRHRDVESLYETILREWPEEVA